jgi:hypothetical protein
MLVGLEKKGESRETMDEKRLTKDDGRETNS